MIIQVEFLDKMINPEGNEYYILDNSKTIKFTTGTKAKRISNAKAKLDQLKPTLSANQKIRVLEYRNDEPDETRTACVIIQE